LVAAWLKTEEEVTLKRFYREEGKIRLQPANAAMEPIYTDAANLEIQGRVVAYQNHINRLIIRLFS
jgi:repressor LexA